MNSYQYHNEGFQRYLQHFGLSRQQVAMQARVTQGLVWRVEHGQPVQAQTAAKIRAALLRLTNVPYTGSMVLFEQPTSKLHVVRLQPQGGTR